MPNKRNTILTTLVAIAALMLWACNAAAQEVEVLNEESGTECSAALANCEVIAEGESHITALPSGVIVSDCQDDYHIEFNHDGTAHIHWTGVTESGIGCNTTHCEEMSDEWPLHGTEEVAPGVLQIHFELCLRVAGTHTELECEARVSISETATQHQYEISGTFLCAGGARRWELHLLTHPDGDGTHPLEFLHH